MKIITNTVLQKYFDVFKVFFFIAPFFISPYNLYHIYLVWLHHQDLSGKAFYMLNQVFLQKKCKICISVLSGHLEVGLSVDHLLQNHSVHIQSRHVHPPHIIFWTWTVGTRYPEVQLTTADQWAPPHSMRVGYPPRHMCPGASLVLPDIMKLWM